MERAWEDLSFLHTGGAERAFAVPPPRTDKHTRGQGRVIACGNTSQLLMQANICGLHDVYIEVCMCVGMNTFSVQDWFPEWTYNMRLDSKLSLPAELTGLLGDLLWILLITTGYLFM